MSRIETFEQLVSAITSLPASHRRVAFCVECNRIAEDFRGLVNDVTAATKAASPKAPAKLIRKPIKCRQPRS
jgi:hypothetical protein